MDVCFAIYLPVDADWSAFPFQVPMFEWGGVQYPQGEPECTFGLSWKLKKMPPHQPNMPVSMPLSHRTTVWQSIFIDGDGLYNYYSSLMGVMEEEAGHSLEKLLQWILRDQPKWVVLFMPDFDQMDEYLPGDMNTVMEKIQSSLIKEKWGFQIWGGDASFVF